MTPLSTMREMRRAMRKQDEAGAAQALASLGGEWVSSETSWDDGIATVRWSPPSGSVYDEALKASPSARSSFFGLGATVEEAMAALIVEVALAVFRMRVEPLARWVAKVAATAILKGV